MDAFKDPDNALLEGIKKHFQYFCIGPWRSESMGNFENVLIWLNEKCKIQAGLQLKNIANYSNTIRKVKQIISFKLHFFLVFSFFILKDSCLSYLLIKQNFHF